MSTELSVHHAKVDASGRIVLPAEYRAHHRIAVGDTVALVEDEHGLRIKTRAQIIAEAQSFFTRVAPAELLLVDENRPSPKKGAND